ncbi:hypothetical protein [Crocosphaera chwakensis]|uniref:Inactive STAND domain-containing protein n=1 Tax=Crocosphaera chwakensis CCY0110 TaxID=391612 RepID=A3IVY5_9CHRO|nr:hypothetical protein [Crocosphaera chwakensis]EAZ89371.1 hypothetical protein CY0110_30860 [Crocosphaera chwakensis CCY0110]
MADTITLTKSDRQYLLQKFNDFKDSSGCRENNKCPILAEAAKIRLKSQVKKHIIKQKKTGIKFVESNYTKYHIYSSCLIENRQKYEELFTIKPNCEYFILNGGIYYIQFDKILELFDQFIVRANDLSWPTFRRLVGKLNKDQDEISINKTAVIFFCAALGVKLEDLERYQTTDKHIQPLFKQIYHEETREEKIERQQIDNCLSSCFNYDSELAQLKQIALKCDHRMQLYTLIGDDRRYFQWLIKRIKYEIKQWNYLEDCVIIDDISVTSSSINFSSEYLKSRLREKIRINTIKKELNKRNIIMIVKNVDCLDPASLQEIIINQFWNQLKKSVSNSTGFFLLILLSQKNLSFVGSNILENIPIIPLENQFDEQDFIKIIPKLAIALNDQNNWNENTVNWLLEQSDGGNPEKTFTAFHQKIQIN